MTQTLYDLSRQKDGVEILERHVQVDPVHVVLSIAPKYAVSSIVGYRKGKTALACLDRFPQWRKRYWGQHVWSRGYCVSSVGLDEERIRSRLDDRAPDGIHFRANLGGEFRPVIAHPPLFHRPFRPEQLRQCSQAIP
jgi:putative transposase